MSIKLKKKPENQWGKLEITSEMDHLGPEGYVARMNALITVIQLQDEPGQEQWHLLEIIREMLPTPEQAEKMFNTPH